MIRAFAILLVLLLPAAGVADAGPHSFLARVEPPEVVLGQPFTYVIEVVDEPGVQWQLQRDASLGTLSLRGTEVVREAAGEQVRTTLRLQLAIYDALGEAILPDVVLEGLADDGMRRLVVPGVPFTVGATAEGEELEDLRPPQEVRIFSALPIGIALGLLAAVAMVLALVRVLRRKRPEPAPEPRSAEERALEALDALEARGAADWRAFYFELSAIVRTFLEEETTLAAREMTTTELVDALVAREVPGLSLAQLGAWLERGDLHRFANLPASEDEAVADLARAREIVRGVVAARAPAAEEEAA